MISIFIYLTSSIGSTLMRFRLKNGDILVRFPLSSTRAPSRGMSIFTENASIWKCCYSSRIDCYSISKYSFLARSIFSTNDSKEPKMKFRMLLENLSVCLQQKNGSELILFPLCHTLTIVLECRICYENNTVHANRPMCLRFYGNECIWKRISVDGAVSRRRTIENVENWNLLQNISIFLPQ